MKSMTVAAILVASASGAVAADASAPVILAYKIEQANLARPRQSQPPWFNPNRSKVFSKRMVVLLARDEKYMQEQQGTGLLDWDPFMGGQDGEVKRLSIRTLSQDGSKGMVEARFISFGYLMTIRFDVVREAGFWRIDDIRQMGGSDSLPTVAEQLSGKHVCGSEVGTPC